MKDAVIQESQRFFMTGNEVVAWAALAAGADIMYGYPITPQNEIMHYWTRLAPKYGRRFLQTEDEISAGFTTAGGVLAGKKAFTATAGPGNVLMQEAAGMAEMMRLPFVCIVQQRGGPSTATVIYGQQETVLTAWGGNGEGQRIVYSTSTHQELFDYTVKAFQVAWQHRFPTFVLGDGYQAKMREPVTLRVVEARELAKNEPILALGREFRHLRNTYNTEEELYRVVSRHQEDWYRMAETTAEWDSVRCEDADCVIIAHGIVARAAREACGVLRAAGEKVGFFRPITLRPLAVQPLRQALQNAKRIIVAESAYGQLLKLLRDALYGISVPMDTLLRPGVGITTEDICTYYQDSKQEGAACRN